MYPASPNAGVQSLWIGGPLTVMEQMAMRSFIVNGMGFELYCYDDVPGIPTGVTVRDGNAILPRDAIFGYADGFAKGSYAAFSNFFRYKLLLEKGGWWVDMDVVCLRPFDMTDERVWSSERADPPQELIVSTSVIKAPPGEPLMAWAWRACEHMNTANIRFGQIGPRLLQAGVDALALHAFIRPHTFFSPIAFFDWTSVIDPLRKPVFGPETYGVHLWNQMWEAGGSDKNATFSDGCLYEDFKQRFLAPR